MATPPTAATQQDIQNSEKLLDLSNQLIDSINERKKLLKGINAEEQLYFSTVKQQQKLSQDIAANAEKYLGYQIKSKDLSKQIKATQDNAAKTRLAFSTIEGKITQQYQDAVKANSQLIQQIEKENKLNLRANNLADNNRVIFQDLLRRKERGEEVDIRALVTARRRFREAQEEVKNSDKLLQTLGKQQQEQEDIAKTAAEIIKNGKEADKAQQEELAFLERNLHTRKQIEKSTGLLGAMSKAASKIPGIGQYLNADEANDEMEKLAAKIEESGGSATSFTNRFKIGLKGISTLAKGLVENLTSPEAIFAFIIARADQFNKASVNIGKSLGAGAEESDKIAQNIADISNNSSNLNVTFKNAVEAMNQLNTATGGVANYSADTLETQVMLTKQFGLSGEEAAGIYELSVLTGKSTSQVNKEMVKSFASTRNMVKGSADFKATIAAAAKVSGQLQAGLGGSGEAIVKAIVKTQALGTTLEQTKSQGDKLLDFASSLENELQAELLTGKQLNLERARAAALAGDQVALSEELNKNIGTYDEFSKMNVLQQKSLAEAVGLTADELATQLKRQAVAKEQGKSIAEVQADELETAQKRQATQEKFAVAIEKLQDIIGNLVGGPFAMLLEVLGEALNIIGYIVKPIEWLKSLATSIGEIFGSWAKALGPFGILLKGIAGIAILLAAYGAYAALAWIPVVGPLLGAAAAIAVTSAGFSALNAQKTGDMISPADGKTRVSTKEGGLFELSPNDDLLAGPGLASKGKGGGEGGSVVPVSIDITPMVMAINEVKAAIDRLYSKDSSIKMDGKEVGTTLSQGSYKVA